MSSNVNANQFRSMYEDLGLNNNDLGCIMLDVAAIPVTSFIPGDPDEVASQLFYSQHPNRQWLQGAVGETTSHITLLYGILTPEAVQHADTVLAGWTMPSHVELGEIDVFESPFEDDKYSCIVARVNITPELLDAHTRLELLPHINTFPEWKAHVTLAYVLPEYRDAWVAALHKNLPDTLQVLGLNKGDQHD